MTSCSASGLFLYFFIMFIEYVCVPTSPCPPVHPTTQVWRSEDNLGEFSSALPPREFPGWNSGRQVQQQVPFHLLSHLGWPHPASLLLFLFLFIVCVCTHVCRHACVCMCMYVHMYAGACRQECMCMCMYVRMYAGVCANLEVNLRCHSS